MKIKTQVIVTGTRAYGPVTKDSDIDIALIQDEATALRRFLIKKDIPTYKTKVQQLNNYPGYYFNLYNIKINIIYVDDKKEFNIWKKVTEKLQALEPIFSKEERVKTFQRFKMVEEIKCK